MARLGRSLTIAALTTFGLTVLVPGAMAQANNIDPLEGLGSNNDAGANLFGDSSNPFDLLHRAILAPSISSGEYRVQAGRQISTEAEAFRQRQQEALRQESGVGSQPIEIEEETFDGL